MRELPGLNIQYPISREIISGSKVIETRTYPFPKKYIGKELALIETPGPSGDFRARIVAIVKFDESFKYSSKSAFDRDFNRHRVDKKSIWYWSEKAKWGWPIKVVKRFKKPIPLLQKTGIRFTKAVKIAD